jgi:tricorn protease
VGYVHIQGMNQPSLARFQKELRQYRDKEAIVIDQRWNGGGNIEQQLLAVLAVPPYQILVPRGSEESFRPAYGFAGPKVVLQNWRSGSNAEMFPAGFKSLKLGKVLGTPTAGAVIGTGSYRLVDGSTVRMPGSGVYLVDGKRTNMENYGVPPDIMVEPTPEDNLAGRDPVIARAVQELLAELGRPRVTTESGGR